MYIREEIEGCMNGLGLLFPCLNEMRLWLVMYYYCESVSYILYSVFYSVRTEI